MSPDRRAIALLALWLLLALGAALSPALLTAWLAAGAATALVLSIDALRLWRAGPFEASRRVPGSLAVGAWSLVVLGVRNSGAAPAAIVVHDHPPASMRTRGLPRTVELAPSERCQIAYRVYPSERGELRFAPPELVVLSPWRLWRRRRREGGPDPVRVYPNFRDVVKYSLLATDHRTTQLGIRRRPRRGEGLDFHQLREYRAGDSMRQIDWKVTARLRKTISREYQDERDQQIVFLLDCGRKMHSRDDELAHFDHALNALLLLAHVGLRQGDAVGLLTFSGERRWLAPRKGSRQLHPIMNTIFDLQTTTRASDYLRAAQDLLSHIRKRALVVLVSNLRDEDHEELLLAARLLQRTHLVLLASMKERALAQALSRPVRDLDDALRTAATHQYLEGRRRAHERLRRAGVLCLDAEPQQLAVALVNGYLDVKSSGVL